MLGIFEEEALGEVFDIIPYHLGPRNLEARPPFPK